MQTPHDFYGTFIEPLEDRLIRSAWRITRNAADAEDALQAALLAVWRRRHRVLRHPAPAALILKITTDSAYSLARRRGRDRDRDRTTHDASDVPVARADPPWTELAHRELSDALVAAIRRLSKQQAVAITLRVFEELPYDQIAAAMDCSEATARKHIERARKQLQAVLVKYDPQRFTRSPS